MCFAMHVINDSKCIVSLYSSEVIGLFSAGMFNNYRAKEVDIDRIAARVKGKSLLEIYCFAKCF